MGKKRESCFIHYHLIKTKSLHSVASVYFPSGSSVDIAKIEGSSSYKSTMRADGVSQYSTELCGSLSQTASDSAMGATQMPFALSSLGDYLPPQIRTSNHRVETLTGMLRALKTATESYLETTVSPAEVVFPFPASKSMVQALRLAASSTALQLPMSAQPLAGILAARAYGIGGKCNLTADGALDESNVDDPEQLILTIDYSRAALTVLLVVEECGVFEYRRVIHDTRLGLDRLRSTPEASASDLESALRNITKLPLEDGNGSGIEHINKLVLVGESASDPRLHDILRQVLAKHYGHLADASDELFVSLIDPLFAASRGVAWDCWDRLNYSDRDEN